MAADGPTVATARLDRASLEGVVERYLHALVAGDPSQAPLGDGVAFAENDQPLALGEAAWRTIDGLGRYRHVFADPELGEVAVIATVTENGAGAILVVRLRLDRERITEVEQFVIRDPNGYQTYEELGAPDPVWLEPVPPDQRQSREALQAAAWMYFQALERNDGAGIYPFTDDCQRLEHGRPTVDRPRNEGYGHADLEIDFVNQKVRAQYEMGMMAFISRVRDRRALVVDVERGAVLGSSFFDFDGTLEAIQFADGKRWTIPPYFRTPRSHHMNEAFKVLNGSYRYIEMTLLEVPYATRPVWRPRPRTQLEYAPVAPPAAAGSAGGAELVDQVLDGLVRCRPWALPLAGDSVYTENGVRVALGEGLWKSVSGLGAWRISLVDPETGDAGFFGALDEHGLFALLAVRVRAREGLITEIETIVARPERSGQWGELAAATHTMFVPPLLADLDPAGFAAGPAPALGRPPGPGTPRGELVEAVDRYFEGFVSGTAADVPLAEGCQRRENGVRATGNADGPVVDPEHPEFGLFALSCAEQLDAGYVARMSSVRRRPLVVDEEQGLVLDLALLDHAADRASVPVAGVGSIGRATSFAAPSTDLVPQVFRIDGGRITHIEGLVRRVPYGQTGPWDPPLGE